jgi:hypothetical protein
LPAGISKDKLAAVRHGNFALAHPGAPQAGMAARGVFQWLSACRGPARAAPQIKAAANDTPIAT